MMLCISTMATSSSRIKHALKEESKNREGKYIRYAHMQPLTSRQAGLEDFFKDMMVESGKIDGKQIFFC